ncbi:WD40 repeat domain-containing protein [Streptomyces sp. NPDC059917]|uniref:WD40 repeat domain-containing protein n=1 Tax=Streptomyces sp. NPDC059917 TaxID=3347002 RepID=UPI003657DA4C
MGRPEKPLDPDGGRTALLAAGLRELRDGAGRPGYRVMAQRVHYSASTLAEAAKGIRLPSLEVTLAYAQACGGDEAEWRTRWEAAADAGGESVRESAAQPCPYQGLATFQPEDALWFFGRSQMSERLRERVERLPLVGLFGASGSGKSSLLRAGLLGAVEAGGDTASRWRTVLMTPTAHPLEELSDRLAKLSDGDADKLYEDLTADPAALDIAVRGALAAGPEETRLLLVVDQFEELFTLCADETEAFRFIDALLDATHGPGRRTTVVLGVRADFLGRVTRHPGLTEALRDEAQLLLGPPSQAELREIVVRPAARAGMRLDPELAAVVLADAAEQPGSLPLLSHALLETWHQRTGEELTAATYRACGGVRGALAQTAEGAYQRLGPQQDLARRIFLRLAALGEGTEDTRRPITRDELSGLADDEDLAEVLEALAGARLIVLDREVVQLAHEALIRAWPRLHRWLTDDRASLLVHRRLTDAAQHWRALGRDPGALYRGIQLQTARAWAAEHPGEANQWEADFLAAGAGLAAAEEAAVRRRTRLLQRLVACTAVLLVLALLTGGIALSQRQDAQRRQTAALAGELALKSRSLLGSDPALAGLLAVTAARMHPDADTRGAVLSAAAAPRRTEFGTPGVPVYTVAFNPDRTLLASGGSGSVTLWNPATGAAVAEFAGDQGLVQHVQFSGDGRLLASSRTDGASGSVIVWDVAQRRQVNRLVEDGGGRGMAFSADGRLVAVGAAGGSIALHDLSSGARTVLAAGPAQVTSLAFSPDGGLLVSASGADGPLVWEVATGRRIAQLDAARSDSVSFGASGRILAASADDHGLSLWDLSGPTPAAIAPPALKASYAWTPSAPAGERIAVADEAGTVRLWDFRRGVALGSYPDRGRSETVSVALSRDGGMLASAGYNGSIVVHDLAAEPFGGFSAKVTDVRVSPDGATVATAGSDGAVRLWDRVGKPIAVLDGHQDEVTAVAFNPDGRLLAAVSRNRMVTLWDTAQHRRLGEPLGPFGFGSATGIAFAPGGRLLVVAALGLFAWDVSAPAAPVDVTARYASRLATAVAFLPSGDHLLGVGPSGKLMRWDAASGALLSRDDTGQGAVQALALSPDGSVLATSGDGRTVALRDGRTGRRTALLTGHSAAVQTLAFSRDGQRLASAGDDGTVIVWDVATRSRLATLTGHTARIRALAFTVDGALLSGAEDGRVVRWPLDPGPAAAAVCRAAGRSLTREQWSDHLPSVPYRSSCP